MKIKFILKLKVIAYPIFYFIKMRLLNRNKDWIMGRIACMGQDVFKLLNIETTLVNIQKGRVDYLNSFLKNSIFRTRAHKVYFNIKRENKIFNFSTAIWLWNKKEISLNVIHGFFFRAHR